MNRRYLTPIDERAVFPAIIATGVFAGRNRTLLAVPHPTIQPHKPLLDPLPQRTSLTQSKNYQTLTCLPTHHPLHFDIQTP